MKYKESLKPRISWRYVRVCAAPYLRYTYLAVRSAVFGFVLVPSACLVFGTLAAYWFDMSSMFVDASTWFPVVSQEEARDAVKEVLMIWFVWGVFFTMVYAMSQDWDY